jgi:hypothetical protein
LDNKQFFEKSGVLKENVIFVDTRAEKAGICEKLGISFFVDDSLTVLRHLIPLSGMKLRILYNPQKDVPRHYMRLSRLVTNVSGWEDIERLFLEIQREG